MPTFGSLIWTRYRAYIYASVELLTIPVVVWWIKDNITPSQQLNWAAGYMAVFAFAIALTVPVNYITGIKKRFLILGDGAWKVYVPFSPVVPPFIRAAPPLLVNLFGRKVLVPRSELVIVSDIPVDVSGPLPTLGKVKAFSIMLHGEASRRIEYRDGIVLWKGMPLDSSNCEEAIGHFVDPDVALVGEEFGPTAKFEIWGFVHGDRPLFTDPQFMDDFWGLHYLRHPEELEEYLADHPGIVEAVPS
jgi:hypothetical protein